MLPGEQTQECAHESSHMTSSYPRHNQTETTAHRLSRERLGPLAEFGGLCPSISAGARLAPLRHINESRTSVMATKLIANATVAMASCSRIIAPQNG
jgi:hypothetical protein